MSTQCQTEGCGNKVSKPGYKLCLSCWKARKGSVAAKPSPASEDGGAEYLNSTKIAQHFGIKSTLVNAILNELGWLSRAQKGWTATPVSRSAAKEKTHHQSGVPYVLWPSTILQSKILNEAIANYLGENAQDAAAKSEKTHSSDDFRAKFPANFRANDGHFVRSKAELLIDNFLYTNGIVHAYERKLPVEEDVYCDFYIPEGKVYIEYWGLENDSRYAARKKSKLEIYAKYDFNLIELGDKEVGSLEDHLPRLLLKFGIAVD